MPDAPMPRQCFYILPDQFHPENGYIPSLVTEGEAGHQPLTGRGELSEPWFWGKTYDEALRVCSRANAEDFGLDEDAVSEIIESSVIASFRGDAAREDVARKLGRTI